MVDSINPTTIKANDPRIGAVTRVAAAASAVTSAPARATPSTPTLARTMAASAPVDAGRVALIKDAVESGRFPLSPATIADRLIAAKYEWMSHDPS